MTIFSNHKQVNEMSGYWCTLVKSLWHRRDRFSPVCELEVLLPLVGPDQTGTATELVFHHSETACCVCRSQFLHKVALWQWEPSKLCGAVLTNGLWPFVIISIIIINVCISVHVVQCQTCDCMHSCTDLATVEMTARNHSVQPTQGMAGAWDQPMKFTAWLCMISHPDKYHRAPVNSWNVGIAGMK